MWNVKQIAVASQKSVTARFNRYIVECKGVHGVKAVAQTALDLIDTLWNVKLKGFPIGRTKHGDLIDTLWNVKVAVEPEAVVAPFRFNRYIVECKVVSG